MRPETARRSTTRASIARRPIRQRLMRTYSGPARLLLRAREAKAKEEHGVCVAWYRDAEARLAPAIVSYGRGRQTGPATSTR